MKNKINKNVLLGVLFLLKGYAPPVKQVFNHSVSRGSSLANQPISSGLQVAPAAIATPVAPVVPPAVSNLPVQTMSPQGNIAPMTIVQSGIAKTFDEKKHLNEKLNRYEEYSVLQYLVLELMNVLDSLKIANNKNNALAIVQNNKNNPNTLLNGLVNVKFSDISNAGGLGPYVLENNIKSQFLPVFSVKALPMQAIQYPLNINPAESLERIKLFFAKWSDGNSYVYTKDSDALFIKEFKDSYAYFKAICEKYLGQDLHKLILNMPNRINNEISALLNILSTQIVPKLNNGQLISGMQTNVDVKAKINAITNPNSKLVFGVICQAIYTDGAIMDANSANPQKWKNMTQIP